MVTAATVADRTAATPSERNEEGIWGQEISQTYSRVVFRRPLPMQLIEQYCRLAVGRVSAEQTDEGWLVTIPLLQGLWAQEATLKEALDVLEEVVFEWVILKIRDRDRDIPPIESIDLNVL